ncbi:hypothetical protein [Azospirillum doebereinerae]
MLNGDPCFDEIEAFPCLVVGKYIKSMEDMRFPALLRSGFAL